MLLLSACLRGLASTPVPQESGPEFRLVAHLDQSYERADIELLGADGGHRIFQRIDGGATALVTSSTWHQGPGSYTVTMRYVRADGGTGLHSTSFEMRPSDQRAQGYATFLSFREEPQLILDVVERTPPGLLLERSSKISREGHATYVLTNSTQRRLFPGLARLATQRRGEEGWQDVAQAPCAGNETAVLEPNQRLVLEAASAGCLTALLSPGSYQHSISLKTVEPAPAWETYDDDSEITRSIEVAAGFDTTEIGAFSSPLLADVPAGELKLEMTMSGPGGFIAQVMAPDGRSACVCPGSVVGKEGMRASMGIGGPCLTSDLDASVIQCEPIDRDRRRLGDHPPFPFR